MYTLRVVIYYLVNQGFNLRKGVWAELVKVFQMKYKFREQRKRDGDQL